MTHHGNARAHNRARARDRRTAAFQLHDVCARLLDEPDRIAHRLLVRDLIRPERHVADDDRSMCGPRDRLGEKEHLVHGDGNGRALVAEHDHRRGIPDQDQIDAGVLGESSAGGVVRGDHDDLVAAPLHRGELGEGQLAGRRQGH